MMGSIAPLPNSNSKRGGTVPTVMDFHQPHITLRRCHHESLTALGIFSWSSESAGTDSQDRDDLSHGRLSPFTLINKGDIRRCQKP
jgi:hypothetical protein